MKNMVEIGFFKGSALHHKIDLEAGVECIWNYPDDVQEDSIKDDTLYTVIFDTKIWNSVSSVSAGEGKTYAKSTIISLEETPTNIINALEMLEDYKVNRFQKTFDKDQGNKETILIK
jgi:hypothetical protein